MEATPEGVHASCEISDYLTRWPGVQSVVETPDHVFVILVQGSGYTIPRSRLVSGDLKGFVQLFKTTSGNVTRSKRAKLGADVDQKLHFRR
ncbi:MAG: YcxB family protein [Gemmatimonadaceae bacterium]